MNIYLNNYSLSCDEALFAALTMTGGAFVTRHWSIAAQEVSSASKWGHRAVGVIEAVPLLGAVAALIEFIAAKCLRQGSGHGHRIGSKNEINDDGSKIRPGNIVLQKPKDAPKITAALQKIVVKPYDEQPLEACGFPCNFSDLSARYQHHSKSKELNGQFTSLGQNFYFQRARGGGNCFYLSYASGVLHHLMHNSAIAQGLALIESKKDLPGKAETIQLLKELEQTPTQDMLYQILTNEKRMQPFIDFLRAFAIDGVRNKLDEERTKVLRRPTVEWDADALAPIILDSIDVQSAIEKEKQKDSRIDDKEAYCRVQGQDRTDIQRPEIGILHNGLWPLAICLRIDDPLLSGAQKQGEGFLNDYPLAASVVQVMRTGNHFDAMIPKRVGL